jgi:hypothetical protein
MTKEDLDYIEQWKNCMDFNKESNRYEELQINLLKYNVDYGDAWHYKNSLRKQKINELKNYPHFYKDNSNLFNNFKYYKPIFEYNFISKESHRYSIKTIVNDSVFFNFENKEIALNRIDKNSKDFLLNIGYLEMSDTDLITFMSKRLIEKSKIKTNKYK